MNPPRFIQPPSFLLLGLYILLFFAPLAQAADFPSFNEVRQAHIPSTAVILDRNGLPLQEIRQNTKTMQLEWLTLHELSPNIQEALLAAEDHRFFEHSGVDWRALAAAMVQNTWYKSQRGASTITMQLAGLLDPTLAPKGSTRRSMEQKWDQTWAASTLESRWSKEQILEAYLNMVPFRGELRGIYAASWVLFNRLPQDLDQPAAAVLAVLLRGPNAPAERVSQRACVLLKKLKAPRECEAADTLAKQLPNRRWGPRWNLAPELTKHIDLAQGVRLNSSLEAAWQSQAQTWLAQQNANDPVNPAIISLLVLENKNAQVLAYTQSKTPEPLELNTETVLTPWILAQGLEARRFTLANLLPTPKQAPASQPGWQSIRNVAANANLATLRPLLTRSDFSQAYKTLPPELGSWLQSPFITPSSTELAGLFRSLAFDGSWLNPTWHKTPAQVASPTQLLSPETRFLISDIFNRHQYTPTPTSSPLSSLQIQSKQGSYLIAWHNNMTTVVQLAPGAHMPDNALNSWLAESAPLNPAPPAQILARTVYTNLNEDPPHTEYFLHGTETELAEPAQPFKARITYPPANAVLDLVPIHPGQTPSQLTFNAEVPFRADWAWRLNGEVIAKGTSSVWTAQPGSHQIELIQANTGIVFDKVCFRVF